MRYGQRGPDERGAALIEAALLLPVLTVFTLGAVDVGLALSTAATETAATRNAARTAAIGYAAAGTATTSQRLVTDDVAAAVVASLGALDSVTPVGVVMYRVDPARANGEPTGGPPGPGLIGGCTDRCVRYLWSGSAMQYASGSWPDPDACGTTVDSVGVAVELTHHSSTGVLGDSRRLTARSVMRLEPLPSSQCG